MSVQAFGIDSPETAKAGKQALADRVIGVIVRLARTIADEVTHMMHEDARHGRISRDPKDWKL